MAGDLNWADVVLLMHFDGANSGTIFHDSSLSNHSFSEISGASITTSQALYGTGALDGNSGSGAVFTNNSTDFEFGSGQFTLEASVYPTSATARSIVMNCNYTNGGSAKCWALYADPSTSTNNISFNYTTDGTTTTAITASFALPLNTWTQLACDYDGATLRLYANGSVIGTGTLSGAIFASTSGHLSTNDDSSNLNAFAGYLDEFRITKGVARYAGAYTAPSAPFPAYGTSPQPENVANSGNGAGSGNATNASITYNLTTWEPNDILVVAVFNENNGTGNPATVASITSSGLSFAQRSIISATNGGGIEVWWALAPTPLIAQSMTIAFTGSFDDASSVAFGVAGCNTNSPWDSNGSLPATASGFSITGFSTASPDDCLVTFVGSASGELNPFGFTTIATTSNVAGPWGSSITTGYQDVSSLQSSISLAAGTGTFAAFIADALTADVTKITGVEGDGFAGNAVAADSNPIAGVSATGSAGSPSAETNAAPTGVSATGSAGSPTEEIDVPLVGAAASGLAGAAGHSATIAVTGVSATNTIGSLDHTLRLIPPLASVSATGFAHPVNFESGSNLFFFADGVAATGSAGVATGGVSGGGLSASASGLAGTPQIASTIVLTGAGATGAVASPLFEIDSNANPVSASGIGLAGNTSLDVGGNLYLWLGDVSAAGAAGNAAIEVDAIDLSAAATGSAGTPQGGVAAPLTGAAATGAVGAATVTVYDSPAVIGVLALGQVSLGAFLGSNSQQIAIAITGASATGSAGTTTTSSFDGVTGVNLLAVAATGSAGNFTFAFGNSVTLVGVAATGTAGQILQAPSIQGVVGAGSVILGTTVSAFDIGGITGQNVSSLTITTTTTVPKGGVIVVAVALNSTTLVLVSDGTNTYSTTSTTHGTGTVAQISWTAPLTAPLLAGSTITMTPLGLMSGVASAFYLTNVTTAAQTTNGNASTIPTTTPTAIDVNAQFANTYVVEVLAANGPFSDTFTQDPNGWSNFPIKRGTSGGGSNFYVAGGTQWWAYGILTYAPTITADPWALTGVGFTVDANITTAEQVHTTGVAATGTAAPLSGLAFSGVSSTGSAGTVTPTGANIVQLSPTGVAATGSAGAFTFVIDAILNGVAGTGIAGVLFPRAATTFFVVT